MNSSMPPAGVVCRQSSTQAASAPTCSSPARHAHVFQAAFGEGEEDDAVVGGDIDEAVSGEIFEHALADPVVGGIDAEGEGVAGVGGLWILRPSTEMTWRNSTRSCRQSLSGCRRCTRR